MIDERAKNWVHAENTCLF